MTNTFKNIILIITLTFGCQNVCGQELNEDYMLFSKTDNQTEYLEFMNDSIVKRKPYYFQNGCGLANMLATKTESDIYKDYRYTKKNDTIKIYNYENTNDIVLKLTEDKFLNNADLEMIYVLRNIYDKYPDVAVMLGKEIFWLDERKGKKNRKLARIMRKKDTTNIDIKVYKGYQAFEKFGHEYVFGIIEVREK